MVANHENILTRLYLRETRIYLGILRYIQYMKVSSDKKKVRLKL